MAHAPRPLRPALLAALLLCGPALGQPPAAGLAPAPTGTAAPASGKAPAEAAAKAPAKAPGAAARKAGLDVRQLKLPSLGGVPKAEGVTVPVSGTSALPEGTRTLVGARYSVVGVVHAAAFAPAAAGPRPVGPPLTALALAGQPRQTPRFSTLVRVRSPARAGAGIEVALVDAGGDTVMGTTGTLAFGPAEETTFQVDWAPTAVRQAGAYQVLVRVAGEPLGTWPLEVREARATP
jgi:hypothetical protein